MKQCIETISSVDSRHKHEPISQKAFLGPQSRERRRSIRRISYRKTNEVFTTQLSIKRVRVQYPKAHILSAALLLSFARKTRYRNAASLLSFLPCPHVSVASRTHTFQIYMRRTRTLSEGEIHRRPQHQPLNRGTKLNV